MASSHRVSDLEKNPVRISKDEARRLLSVVGPLFISSQLFHLFLTVLGAWHFSLFHCVYSNFHNRLDLIREPAFYWVFYFPSLSLFVFIRCKNEKVLFILVQQTSNFMTSLGYGLGLGQLQVLAIHCFFSWLALLFLKLYRSFMTPRLTSLP